MSGGVEDSFAHARYKEELCRLKELINLKLSYGLTSEELRELERLEREHGKRK